MQYFKNVELTKLYPVSESAIRKWIEATKQGKLSLQLYEHNGKSHIANTTKNMKLIEQLVEKGKKYKNTRSHKVVTPKPEFYELYDKKQILDIISNIEIHHEIPRQYSYFDKGANYWNKYSKRLWQEDSPNTLTSTVELLTTNVGSLDNLLEGFDRVNVIDLGVGNGLPVKELLTHLHIDRHVLGRYIAIDISKQLLDITEKNITEWFNDEVAFEGYVRDYSYQRFDDLLVDEAIRADSDKTLNLVLLLGDTLNNFRTPSDALRTIYNSMSRDDLFVFVTKLDSDEARRHFDFGAEAGVPKLSEADRLVLDLLNVDESFYDVEQFYNDTQNARFVQIGLNVDVTIKVQFDSGERDVELHKGDKILLLRVWHKNVLEVVEQFNKNGFALLQASTSSNRQYFLTICGVDFTSQAKI